MDGKGFMALRLRNPERGPFRFEPVPARIRSRETSSVEPRVHSYRVVGMKPDSRAWACGPPVNEEKMVGRASSPAIALS
jgi:hypothetical protein